jgi:AAHS family 4-hydroxybenzoate transporter-like MFS transporter
VLLSLNGVAPQRAAMAGVLLNLGGVLGALILSFIIGRKSPVLAVAVALFVGAIIVVLFGQVRVLTGAAAMLWVFAIGALAAVPSSIAAIAMTALFVRRIK